MANINAFPFDAILSNGVYDREYTSDDFASYYSKVYTNGIFSNEGNCLEPIADSTSMFVTLKDGGVFIDGRSKDWLENQSIRISNSHASYDRYDLIVARLSLLDRDITIEVVEGEASANPIVPTVTQTEDIFELCIAQVRVKTGVTSITQADITDKRGTSLCGYVKSKLELAPSTREIIKISPSEWDTTNKKYRLTNSKIAIGRDIDIAPATAEYYVDERGWTSSDFLAMIDQIAKANFFVRRHNNGYIDIGYLGEVPTVNVYFEVVYKGV